MSAADQLRQAADAIRERAQAATPGPWAADRTDGYDAQEVYSTSTDGQLNEPEVASTYSNPLTGDRKANAAHIAGMHPGVALAVADWIASHARDLTYAADDINRCDSPGDVRSALAVARAYLGEATS